jgi:hypothetical protein
MYCPFWMEFSLYDFKITLLSICKFHDNRRGGLHKCTEYLSAYREADEMYKGKRVLVKHVYCVTQHASSATQKNVLLSRRGTSLWHVHHSISTKEKQYYTLLCMCVRARLV